MSENIVAQLTALIAAKMAIKLNAEEIDPCASLFEDGLGLDSIELVELIGFIEKQFNIRFSDDELTPENFSSIRILADVVGSKTAAEGKADAGQREPVTFRARQNIGQNVWVMYIRALHFGVGYADLVNIEKEASDSFYWCHTLAQIAERHFNAAKEALDANRILTARQWFYTAAVYYHFAQTYYRGEKKSEYQALSRHAYMRFAPLIAPPSRKISIPCGDIALPGYARIVGPGAPCVLLVGALYSSKEVELHGLAEPFVQRGMSVLFADVPSRGELSDIPMPARSENVVSAMIDFVLSQEDFGKPDHIGAFGICEGGYLMARASAMDRRISACAMLSSFFDGSVFKNLAAVSKELLPMQWGTDNLEILTGPDSPVSLAKLPQSIVQPLFIVSGGKDHLVPLEQTQKICDWAQGETKVWVLEDAEHMCFSRLNEVMPTISDWMKEQLMNS